MGVAPHILGRIPSFIPCMGAWSYLWRDGIGCAPFLLAHPASRHPKARVKGMRRILDFNHGGEYG